MTETEKDETPTACWKCGGSRFFEEYGEWVCRSCDAVNGPVIPTEVCRETCDPIAMRCVIEDGRHMHFPPEGSPS